MAGHLNGISRVGVVGLGTIGSQELALWQRSGHQTVGYDISESRVKALAAGSASQPDARLTARVEDLGGCDALILCLPNLTLAAENTMDAFDQFVADVQGLSDRERLIVVASTVPIGFTRDLAARFGRHGRLISHAPERFDPGRGTALGEIPRVVGATSAEALNLTVELYKRAGVPTLPRYLLEAAEEIGLAMPILRDAITTDELIIQRVADHLRDLLAGSGITRGHVLVVGATYKPNYPDARASAALAFARGLAAHHQVVVYDPIVEANNFPREIELVREVPTARFDAVVIALKHRDTDMAALRKLSPILLDLVRGAVEVTESISTRK